MDTKGFALVVGAGSGIGLETGLQFAERGAQGIVFADIDSRAADHGSEESKKIASSPGYKTLAIEVDVTDLASVQAMVSRTVKEFGRVDYFVNSAGIPRQNEKPITEVNIEEFDQLHNVNCKGVLNCLTAVMKQMHSQIEQHVTGRSGRRSIGKGAIVNVVSLSGIIGHPNSVTYTASKFAANGVSKCAAMEGQKDGIRVNSLCPGFTDTPMLQKGLLRNPRLGEAINKAMPLKRVATAEEIAGVALFLASPAASFMNGQVVVADSGVSLSAAG